MAPEASNAHANRYDKSSYDSLPVPAGCVSIERACPPVSGALTAEIELLGQEEYARSLYAPVSDDDQRKFLPVRVLHAAHAQSRA